MMCVFIMVLSIMVVQCILTVHSQHTLSCIGVLYLPYYGCRYMQGIWDIQSRVSDVNNDLVRPFVEPKGGSLYLMQK